MEFVGFDQQCRVAKLSGTFDIIFVDANKDGYQQYVKMVLDQKLLAPNGIILCDNGRSSFDHHIPMLPVTDAS